MTNDDVLDVSRLEEAYGPDAVAIADFLASARQTELRYLSALRAAIGETDLREVLRAAHSIKGSASNIGAMKVSVVAAEIEDRARQATWDDITVLAGDLDAVFAELSARIDAYAAAVAAAG